MPLNALVTLKAMKLSLQNALASDHSVHQAPPAIRIRLCPYTVPSLPVARMNAPAVSGYDAAIQVADGDVDGRPNVVLMCIPPPIPEPKESICEVG